MPFVVASLKLALETVFKDVADGNTGDAKAADLVSAIHDFATTGTPMTLNSGSAPLKGLAPGQTILLGLTTTPGVVTADGEGGIDSSSAGSGLSSAKADLVSALKATFENMENTPTDAADQMSSAIETFFKAAKIQTLVTGVSIVPGVVPIPPPAGPVGAESYTASGIGGIDKPTPGITLAVSKPLFELDLKGIFTEGAMPADYQEAADKWADYIEKYFKEAMVQTTDSGTAGGGPAVVAPPPAPPNGVTGPLGSNIISGTGSGSLS